MIRVPRMVVPLTTWVVLYPSITLVSWIGGPWVSDLALPLRTMVTMLVVVPLMTWVLMPAALRLRLRLRLRGRWRAAGAVQDGATCCRSSVRNAG